MERINLTNYQIKPKSLPAHRFQELVLESFLLFQVDAKGKGMIWGRIGKAKKRLTDVAIERQLQYAINETKELKPKNPGRYFVKLVFKYLK